ncbi:MAG: hypothetical protein H6624_12930 [Bdellovibrionaceae bacterium]|nr:hypothetical protein [Bdellovibrionales bacterium]MCB9085247.1 hypothetical protein [Pseudobdellovibrionaceae bacterium]
MTNKVQIKVSGNEFNQSHAHRLNNVLTQVEEILPRSSTLNGHITGSEGQYHGRIHIYTRIGAFVARAKARNIFTLIAKLQAKILRQIVNWREKRAAKKRYLRRKRKLVLLPSQD